MSHYALVTSALILILAYVAIGTEKIHKAVVALLAAALVMILKLLPAKEVFAAIDFNVIFLLTGMMVIVGITKHTGLFQWIAIKAAKLVKGRPMALLVVFALVTAVVSAFLDNVTTVLLIGPVTLLIANELRLDPVPFVISEALASNIGGTATLIGDPPNIMIGSGAKMASIPALKDGLNFIDFLANLSPVIIVMLIIFCLTLWLFFRKRLRTTPELMARVTELNERKAITDKPLLYKSLAVIALVVTAFVLHPVLGYEPGEVALAGAAVLLLLKGGSPEETLKEVDWTTILFFIGLFIVVGAAKESGLIRFLAQGLLSITGNQPLLTGLLILWASAFLSAFIDNIPYVATMIPLIHELVRSTQMGPEEIKPLWWALAMGACLGGNGTIIGASANVVLTGIAGKSGHHISFLRFTKYGFPIMILTVFISSIYLILRYYHQYLGF